MSHLESNGRKRKTVSEKDMGRSARCSSGEAQDSRRVTWLVVSLRWFDIVFFGGGRLGWN